MDFHPVVANFLFSHTKQHDAVFSLIEVSGGVVVTSETL